VIELLAGFLDVHNKTFLPAQGSVAILLTTQSAILQLIFGVRCKEIKATATIADPTIGKLDAAISEPGGVAGFDAVDDLSQQAVTAGEDGDAYDLIFLNGTVGDKSIEGFCKDGIGNGFK